jgi:hypothetical protein
MLACWQPILLWRGLGNISQPAPDELIALIQRIAKRTCPCGCLRAHVTPVFHRSLSLPDVFLGVHRGGHLTARGNTPDTVCNEPPEGIAQWLKLSKKRPINVRILLANSKVPKCVCPTCLLCRHKSWGNFSEKKYS